MKRTRSGTIKSRRPVNKQQVRTMITNAVLHDSERKFWYTNLGTTAAPQSVTSTGSGSIVSLTAIAQGLTNLTRVGNNATVKEINGKISFYPDSTDITNCFRLVIYKWTDTTSANTAAIFEIAGSLLVSPFNVNNIKTKKLQILYDRLFPTSYNGMPKAATIKLKTHIPVSWSSTSAVAAITNDIGVCVVSDSTAVPSPQIISTWELLADQ